MFAAQAQITINQLPVVHDPLSNMLLCSVPQEIYGTDWTATIILDEGVWDEMIIDGQKVTDVTPYTFHNITGGKTYDVQGITGTDTTLYHITFTYYPILKLHSLEGAYHQRRYKMSKITIIMPGEQAEEVDGKIKWRGNTTVRYYREKRNYHLKFTDAAGEKVDRSFFGLRNDNSWILDAGQVDNARIRNRVGMDLWRDLTPKMYYADREPKAMNWTRNFMIEVFLEGNYHGIYAMGEAMDRKQLKLKKYEQVDDSTQVIHGLLWKSSAWNDYTMMGNATQDYDPTSEEWNGYEMKYPDIEEVNPTDYQTLWEAINFVVNSTDSEFKKNVGKYFDLPVLQYYYILYELLVAFDNGGKNMYWAVYDKQQDKKLTLAAWDFDATVGQYYINVYSRKDTANFSPERNLQMGHILFSRLLSLNPDKFKTQMKRNYYAMRKNMLREDSLVARYVDAINDLQRCGAAQREEVRWSGVVDLNYKDLDFEYQKEYIAQWWHRRLKFLDETFFKVTPVAGDVNRDWQVDVTDVNQAIDVLLGKTPYDSDADLNGDGIVDVDDVNAIIDIVLGKS